MPRYTDVDKLKTDILMKYKKHWEVPCSSEDRLIQSIVTDLRVLIEMNTIADVVPRVEVEKLHEVIFKKEDLMQKIAEERNKYADELEVVKDTNEHLKAEVAREIFEEIEDVLNNIGYFDELDFEALKNKYAEGEK